MSDEITLNNTSHGSSSEASEDASKFSFLQHLRDLSNPDNDSPAAKKWRTTRSLGNCRVFDAIPCPEDLSGHIAKLYQHTDDLVDLVERRESITNEFAKSLLAYFNELIDENGGIKPELLAFTGQYIDTAGTTQHHNMVWFTDSIDTEKVKVEQLWAAIAVWAGQCLNDYVEEHQEYEHKRVTIKRSNPKNAEEVSTRCMSVHAYLTVTLQGQLELDDSVLNGQYTLKYREDANQYTLVTDEDKTYNTLKEEFACLANACRPENFPYEVALTKVKQIASLTDSIKSHDKNSTPLLNDTLFTVIQTVEAIKSDHVGATKLNGLSVKLTELANTLIQYENQCQSQINRQKKLQLAAILMNLVGMAIVVMSIAVAGATLGLAAPISVLGIHIGVSMIGFGLACTAGAIGLTAAGVGFFTARKAGNRISELQDSIPKVTPIAKELNGHLTELAEAATEKANSLKR